MRFALVLLSTMAVGLSWAQQVKLALSMGGQPAGSATFAVKDLPNKGLSVRLEMAIEFQGVKFEGLLVDELDRNAMPVRRLESEKMQGESRSTTITYGAKNVVIKRTQGGKTTTETIAIPKDAKTSMSSNFWFIRTRPKPGQTSTTTRYSNNKNGWETKTTKYVGPTTITLKGKSVKAHKLTQSDSGVVYLDDKGMPLLIELKNEGNVLRLERQ